MVAVSPLNTIRFGFSDRQYRLATPEEVGPGTRVLRRVASALKTVLPYTLQETTPSRQAVLHDNNQPVVVYYLTQQGQPGQYQLYMNA